jgi:prevent-host-death family protein
MTRTVSVDEAQNKLPDLLAQALAGNDVIITEHGTPVARLVPVVTYAKKKRVPGLNRGSMARLAGLHTIHYLLKVLVFDR